MSSNATLLVKGGKPITFYIRPCKQKAFIANKVKEYGGEVVVSALRADHVLYLPGDIVSSRTAIESTYIDDCIARNKILDAKKYCYAERGLKASVLRPDLRSQRTKSDESGTDDTFTFEQPNAFHGKKGLYSRAEDMLIIEKTLKLSKQYSINGNNLWKQLERLKVVERSAQSMKERFIKKVLPHIEDYKIDDAMRRKFRKLQSKKTSKVQNLLVKTSSGSKTRSAIEFDNNEFSISDDDTSEQCSVASSTVRRAGTPSDHTIGEATSSKHTDLSASTPKPLSKTQSASADNLDDISSIAKTILCTSSVVADTRPIDPDVTIASMSACKVMLDTSLSADSDNPMSKNNTPERPKALRRRTKDVQDKKTPDGAISVHVENKSDAESTTEATQVFKKPIKKCKGTDLTSIDSLAEITMQESETQKTISATRSKRKIEKDSSDNPTTKYPKKNTPIKLKRRKRTRSILSPSYNVSPPKLHNSHDDLTPPRDKKTGLLKLRSTANYSSDSTSESDIFERKTPTRNKTSASLLSEKSVNNLSAGNSTPSTSKADTPEHVKISKLNLSPERFKEKIMKAFEKKSPGRPPNSKPSHGRPPNPKPSPDKSPRSKYAEEISYDSHVAKRQGRMQLRTRDEMISTSAKSTPTKPTITVTPGSPIQLVDITSSDTSKNSENLPATAKTVADVVPNEDGNLNQNNHAVTNLQSVSSVDVKPLPPDDVAMLRPTIGPPRDGSGDKKVTPKQASLQISQETQIPSFGNYQSSSQSKDYLEALEQSTQAAFGIRKPAQPSSQELPVATQPQPLTEIPSGSTEKSEASDLPPSFADSTDQETDSTLASVKNPFKTPATPLRPKPSAKKTASRDSQTQSANNSAKTNDKEALLPPPAPDRVTRQFMEKLLKQGYVLAEPSESEASFDPWPFPTSPTPDPDLQLNQKSPPSQKNNSQGKNSQNTWTSVDSEEMVRLADSADDRSMDVKDDLQTAEKMENNSAESTLRAVTPEKLKPIPDTSAPKTNRLVEYLTQYSDEEFQDASSQQKSPPTPDKPSQPLSPDSDKESAASEFYDCPSQPSQLDLISRPAALPLQKPTALPMASINDSQSTVDSTVDSEVTFNPLAPISSKESDISTTSKEVAAITNKTVAAPLPRANGSKDHPIHILDNLSTHETSSKGSCAHMKDLPSTSSALPPKCNKCPTQAVEHCCYNIIRQSSKYKQLLSRFKIPEKNLFNLCLTLHGDMDMVEMFLSTKGCKGNKSKWTKAHDQILLKFAVAMGEWKQLTTDFSLDEIKTHSQFLTEQVELCETEQMYLKQLLLNLKN